MITVQHHNHGGSTEHNGTIAEIGNTSIQTSIPTDILRTFIAICELGSFTKAARIFGLTQPAISAQIKKLESLVGASLISRNVPGISLTIRGTEVLALARRMLSINDQILAGSRSQAAPVVRIGVPSLFANSLLQRFKDDRGLPATNTRVQVSCDNSANLLHNIRSGYLEIACVLGDDLNTTSAKHSWPEEFVWARAPHATFRGREPVPLVGSPSRVLSDRIALEALTKANQRYEIVYSAYDRLTRYAATEFGLGYLPVPRRSVLPTLAIEEDGHLPSLRTMTAAIITREGLDPEELAPLIDAIDETLHGGG